MSLHSRPFVADTAEDDLPWDADAQQRDRRKRWSSTTPSERLAWLERAIRFAGAAGTLPRRRR